MDVLKSSGTFYGRVQFESIFSVKTDCIVFNCFQQYFNSPPVLKSAILPTELWGSAQC